MGTHSDGYEEQKLLTTVVTCEGDLSDPQFNAKFSNLVYELRKLLLKDPDQYLDVIKVEPWNSVRVTFTIPREAALKLRQLAQQGDTALSSLGILSVQLEGDQAISLRIAGRIPGGSQEIILKTVSADNGDSSMPTDIINSLISGSAAPVAALSTVADNTASVRTMTQALVDTIAFQNAALVSSSFKSPNVIVSSSGPTTSVPYSTVTLKSTLATTSSPMIPSQQPSAFSAVVTQATGVPQQNTSDPSVAISSSSTNSSAAPFFSLPPPPYPHTLASTTSTVVSSSTVSYKSRSAPFEASAALCSSTSSITSPANVALSSPLLVNLLQNDGVPINSSNKIIITDTKQKVKLQPHSSAKRKNSAPETTNNVHLHHQHQHQHRNSLSQAALLSINSESPIIQRAAVQRVQTTISDSYLSSTVTNSNNNDNNSNNNNVNNNNSNNNDITLENCVANHLSNNNSHNSNNVSSSNNNGTLTSVTSAVVVSTISNCNVSTKTSPSVFINTNNNININSSGSQIISSIKKQTTPVVNLFQRPTSAPGPLLSTAQLPQQQQNKSILFQNTNSQLLNKLPLTDNHPQHSLTLEQAQKLGLRVISLHQNQLQQQQQQQHVLQPNRNKHQQIQIKSNNSGNFDEKLSATCVQSPSDVQQHLNTYVVPSSSSISSGILFDNSSMNPQTVNQINTLSADIVSTIDFLKKSAAVAQLNSSAQHATTETVIANNNSSTMAQHKLLKTTSQENTGNSKSLQQSMIYVTHSASHLADNISSSSFQNQFSSNVNNLVTSSFQNQFVSSTTNSVVTSSLQNQFTLSTANSIVTSSFQNQFVSSSQTTANSATPASLSFVNSANTVDSATVAVQQQKSSTVKYKKKLPTKSIDFAATSNNQATVPSDGANKDVLKVFTNNLTTDPLFNDGDKKCKTNSDSSGVVISNTISSNLTSAGKERQFLINPLTGEMEPMPSESSSDSEPDNQTDIFSTLTPNITNEDSFFNFSSSPLSNEKPVEDDAENKKIPSDNSTISSEQQGDIESLYKSLNYDNNPLMKNRLKGNLLPISDSASTSPFNSSAGEKIKLRLKLEKNEPIINAYKVDVSFGSKTGATTTTTSSTPAIVSPTFHGSSQSNEEPPRVPPLHISLRGKSAAVVKKDNKKWTSTVTDELAKDSCEDSNALDKKMFVKFKSAFDKKHLGSTELEVSSGNSSVSLGEKFEFVDGVVSSASTNSSALNNNLLIQTTATVTSVANTAPVLQSASSQENDSSSSMLPYNHPVMTPMRTFPTEAEITSILRSVSSDAPNKMSLSCVKIKKKDIKRKLGFSSSRDNCRPSDDSADMFSRVINDTKTSLSQAKTKSRTGSSVSLLRSVMKSSAAKEARMMGASIANRHLEKRQAAAAANNATNIVAVSPSESNTATFSKNCISSISMHQQQRRPSNELGLPVRINRAADPQVTGSAAISTVSSSTVMSPSSVSSSSAITTYAQSSSHVNTISSVYNSHHKSVVNTKKFVNNLIASKRSVSNFSHRNNKDYRNSINGNSKFEMKKDFSSNSNSNNDIKRSSAVSNAFLKRNTFVGMEHHHNSSNVVTVGCVQVVPKIDVTSAAVTTTNANSATVLPKATLDITDKIVKQKLLEHTVVPTSGNNSNLDAEVSKKQLSHSCSSEFVVNSMLKEESFNSGNSCKEIDTGINGAGNESPIGGTSGDPVNNQGEDSGIESMDALSEKSPNQGESPCRKDDKELIVDTIGKESVISTFCEKTVLMDDQRNKMDGNASDRVEDCNDNQNTSVQFDSAPLSNANATVVSGSNVISSTSDFCDKSENRTYVQTETISSPDDLEDVRPFRLTPALYTYSNPDKIRLDSPSPPTTPLQDISEEIPSISSPPSSSSRQQHNYNAAKSSLNRIKRKRKDIDGEYSVEPESMSEKSLIGTAAGPPVDRYANRSNISVGGKSLLEQLLIDSAENTDVKRTVAGMPARNTRSQLKGVNVQSPDATLSTNSPSSSSRTSKSGSLRSEEGTNRTSPRPSLRATPRRLRKGQDANNLVISGTEEGLSLLRSNKRRCTENISNFTKTTGSNYDDFDNKKTTTSSSTAQLLTTKSISGFTVVSTSANVISISSSPSVLSYSSSLPSPSSSSSSSSSSQIMSVVNTSSSASANINNAGSGSSRLNPVHEKANRSDACNLFSTRSNTTRPIGKRKRGNSEHVNADVINISESSGVRAVANPVKLISHSTEQSAISTSASQQQGSLSFSTSTVPSSSSISSRVNANRSNSNRQQQSSSTSALSPARRSIRNNHVTSRRRNTNAYNNALPTAVPVHSKLNSNNNDSNLNINKNMNNNNNNNIEITKNNLYTDKGISVANKMDVNLQPKLNCVSDKNLVQSTVGFVNFNNSNNNNDNISSNNNSSNNDNNVITDNSNSSGNIIDNSIDECITATSANNSSSNGNNNINNSSSSSNNSSSHKTTSITINTRGTSMKQQAAAASSSFPNESGASNSSRTSSQENIQHHNILTSEDVINTRRKTRSIITVNDTAESSRRRRSSRDGK